MRTPIKYGDYSIQLNGDLWKYGPGNVDLGESLKNKHDMGDGWEVLYP
jgi:hypothetical protein